MRDNEAADIRFSHFKWQWLKQVALDQPNLPPLATAICVWLAQYFRKYDGVVWAYQETLAQEFRVRRECINKTLNALVDREHLTDAKRRGTTGQIAGSRYSKRRPKRQLLMCAKTHIRLIQKAIQMCAKTHNRPILMCAIARPDVRKRAHRIYI